MHYSQGLNLISIDSQCGSFLCKELLCVWIIICQRHSGVWRWVLTSVEVDLFRLNGYESYYKFTREKNDWHIAPCKEIQDSLGFWIPRRGFRILILSRIPDSLSCIPGSTNKTFPGTGFHKQKFHGIRNPDPLQGPNICCVGSGVKYHSLSYWSIVMTSPVEFATFCLLVYLLQFSKWTLL